MFCSGLLLYFGYFFSFSHNIVCYSDPHLKDEFETHCWNNMEIVVWKHAMPIIATQMGLLLVPFLIWKLKDRNLLARITSDSEEAIVDFFITTRKQHKMYVCTYLFLELCNLVLVALLSWLMYWMLGVTFFDVYADLQTDPYTNQDRRNFWDQIFPLHSKCEWTHESMVAGARDRYSSGCDIKLNGLRKNIMVADVWFLTGLGLLGIFNILFRLLVVLVKPLRRYRLKWSGGCLSPTIALNAFANHLGFCDFFVLAGIGDQVSAHVFTNLCICLHSRMYQLDVADQNDDDKEQDHDKDEDVETTSV